MDVLGVSETYLKGFDVWGRGSENEGVVGWCERRLVWTGVEERRVCIFL